MSYSIELDQEVARRLREVPPQYASLIVDQIDRLGENPRLGSRISSGPLEGRMLYTFVIDPVPRVLRLAVLYLFGSDEEKIYITEVGLLRGDGPRLHIAENWPPG